MSEASVTLDTRCIDCGHYLMDHTPVAHLHRGECHAFGCRCERFRAGLTAPQAETGHEDEREYLTDVGLLYGDEWDTGDE